MLPYPQFEWIIGFRAALTESSEFVLTNIAQLSLNAFTSSSFLNPSAPTTSTPALTNSLALGEVGLRVIPRTRNTALLRRSDRTTEPPWLPMGNKIRIVRISIPKKRAKEGKRSKSTCSTKNSDKFWGLHLISEDVNMWTQLYGYIFSVQESWFNVLKKEIECWLYHRSPHRLSLPHYRGSASLKLFCLKETSCCGLECSKKYLSELSQGIEFSGCKWGYRARICFYVSPTSQPQEHTGWRIHRKTTSCSWGITPYSWSRKPWE